MNVPASDAATANLQQAVEPEISARYRQALHQAASKVAPVWPLDQWIAVNPWWGMKQLPIEQAEHQLAQRAGIRLTMPTAFYRDAWEQGRIQRIDLTYAIDESGKRYSEEALLALLKQNDTPQPRYLSVWELPESIMAVAHQNMTIEAHQVFDQVAEICQRYFDRQQQRWQAPHSGSLFSEWKLLTRFDRRWPSALREPLENLPDDIDHATVQLVEALGLEPEGMESLVHTLLLRVNGWASWCQGLSWHAPEAQKAGGIQALTAILLAWEWLGVSRLNPAHQDAWRRRWQPPELASVDDATARWCWQRAYEIAYQRRLARILLAKGDQRSCQTGSRKPCRKCRRLSVSTCVLNG